MGKGTLQGVAEEAEILNTFFAVFTSKSSPRESLTQESRENIWIKTDFFLVKEDWVRDHIVKFDIPKSVDSDGMHPQALRNCQRLLPSRSSLKGHGSQERCLRTGKMSHQASKRTRSTQGTTSWSASPQTPDRQWNGSSWRPSLGKGKTRRSSGLVSMDSPKENHD